MNKAELESIPDWLLDPALAIEKVDKKMKLSGSFQDMEPASHWDEKLEVLRVCYYKRRKILAGLRYPGLSLVHHGDSSDDSSSDSDDDSELNQPLEQIVIHHPGHLFTRRVAVDVNADKKSEVVALASKWIGREAGNLVQNILQPFLPCIQQIDVRVLDDDMNTKFIIDSSLEHIKSQFYKDIHFNSSQYQVCLELLKGRHPASKGKKRYNIFFSAPCGFGKSLCFVVAAYALGGITVSLCVPVHS